MGRFDKAAGKAAEKTDRDLKEELDKFLKMDPEQIAKMLPETRDRAEVLVLVEKINKSTSDNEKAQAIKEFGLALTEAGARGVGSLIKAAEKIVSKIAKAALMIMVLLTPAQAASMTFGEFLAGKVRETKGLYVATWKNDRVVNSGGFYVPIRTFHTKDKKRDYVDFGIGLEDIEGSNGNEKPRIMIPIMINALAMRDNLFGIKWFQEHSRGTELPPIWIGVMLRPPTRISKRGFKNYIPGHNIGLAVALGFGTPWFNKTEDRDE